MDNFGTITLFPEGKEDILLNQNGIQELHKFDWVFDFTDVNNEIGQCFFKTFSLDKHSFSKQYLKNYGTIHSPYTKWELTAPLEISDDFLQQGKCYEGYAESILLSVLIDHNDGKDSMLQSEKYVIQRIKDANWLTDIVRDRLIQQHYIFFAKHQIFHKALVNKNPDFYMNPEHKNELNYFSKVQEVVKYLSKIRDITTTESKITSHM